MLLPSSALLRRLLRRIISTLLLRWVSLRLLGRIAARTTTPIATTATGRWKRRLPRERGRRSRWSAIRPLRGIAARRGHGWARRRHRGVARLLLLRWISLLRRVGCRLWPLLLRWRQGGLLWMRLRLLAWVWHTRTRRRRRRCTRP